jgi:hypothetical protein
MKGFIARFASLVIGGFSLFLLAFTTENAANSIFELATRTIVIAGFISYGLGGNKFLAKIHALKVFSTPITKEHFKSLGNSTGQGKA